MAVNELIKSAIFYWAPNIFLRANTAVTKTKQPLALLECTVNEEDSEQVIITVIKAINVESSLLWACVAGI